MKQRPFRLNTSSQNSNVIHSHYFLTSDVHIGVVKTYIDYFQQPRADYQYDANLVIRLKSLEKLYYNLLLICCT